MKLLITLLIVLHVSCKTGTSNEKKNILVAQQAIDNGDYEEGIEILTKANLQDPGNKEIAELLTSNLVNQHGFSLLETAENIEQIKKTHLDRSTKSPTEKGKNFFELIIKSLGNIEYNEKISMDFKKAESVFDNYEKQTNDDSLTETKFIYKTIHIIYLLEVVYGEYIKSVEKQKISNFVETIKSDLDILVDEFKSLLDLIPDLTGKIGDHVHDILKEQKEIKFSLRGRQHVININESVEKGLTDWLNSLDIDELNELLENKRLVFKIYDKKYFIELKDGIEVGIKKWLEDDAKNLEKQIQEQLGDEINLFLFGENHKIDIRSGLEKGFRDWIKSLNIEDRLLDLETEIKFKINDQKYSIDLKNGIENGLKEWIKVNREELEEKFREEIVLYYRGEKYVVDLRNGLEKGFKEWINSLNL